MKKLFTMTVIVAMTVCVLAQAPQKMSYQAVIRNSSGQLVAAHAVGMRISILQGSATGTAVYAETHTATTNANGLATIEIGGGALVSGSFSGINWASGPYYVKTETDPAGGTAYSITGTSQVLSVPYSLYAKSAGNGSLWTQNGAKIYYNTGNVGVGISDPLERLHVNGSVLLSTGDKKLILFTQGVGEDIMSTNTLHINYSNNQNVSIGEAGTSNLLVSGKVGIGNINPGAKLEVTGQVKITGGAPGAGKVLTSDATGLATWQTPGSGPWLTNGSNIYYNTGYVGVGTNSPAGFLNLSGNSNTNLPHLLLSETEGDYARLSFKNTAATAKNWSIAGRPDPTDANSLLNFWYWNGTTGQDLMSIKGNGNVGIGTTAPAAFLNVFGNCDVSRPLLLLTENQLDGARLMFKNAPLPTKNWTIAALANTTDNNSIMNFHYDNGTTGKNIMTIEGTGRVGIGTSLPTRLLHVYGVENPRILVQSIDQPPELNLQRGSTTHALYVNGNFDLAFYCAGDRMALTHDGKLGIGTTAPNYTLDVRGTIGNNTTLYHSDMRWKRDIQPVKYGVSELMKLNSVSYLWNANDYPDMGFDTETQFGFIAQEFEKVIPELVRTDKDGYKSIDYVKLAPVLVEAIKEQQKQIDELKSLVNELSAKLSVKSE